MIEYKDVTKRYAAGMYSGKFLPMHKGHLYCLEQASKICNKVFLIMFSNGAMEYVVRKLNDKPIYSIETRWRQVLKAASMFDNVIPIHVDVSNCFTPDRKENWDAETPLVLEACPEKFYAVFSSEPEYDDYFKRAYPWADHILIDSERKAVPISSTKIRYKMEQKEMEKWII